MYAPLGAKSTPLTYALVGLAAWRLSVMMMYETGPYYMLTLTRSFFGVKHTEDGAPMAWPDNSLFSCIYCMSLWASAALLLLPKFVALPFAMSALVVTFDSVTAWLGQKGRS